MKVKLRRKSPLDGHFESAASALASGVFLNLGSKLSLRLLGDVFNGRYRQVVEAEVDPSTYTDPYEFRDDYLAVSLMSKFPDWDIGVDRKAVALSKFRESELACTDTNKRLRAMNVQGLYSAYTPESFIRVAREKIHRLLGPLDWGRVSDHFDFGPGASFGLKSRHGDAYFKYRCKPDVTRDCSVLAYAALRDVPRWFEHVVSLTGKTVDEIEALPLFQRIHELFEIVPGNRVVTVPKNAKTDRTIAIEPLMNLYIQKGLGHRIRSRLKRVGIDLDDQSVNQRLAHWGSVGGRLATIDLSAASDTVSLVLLDLLLPSDWAEALKQCRSPVGVLPDGTRVEYQKVSSMGNGFTFELESLIFWALGSAVNTLLRPMVRPCWVYGDDIIISQDTSHTLIWLLNYCGFSCNSQKTFEKGVFRESCGKHYFNGVDVTPLYIREDITSPARLIWFANQIRRWSRLPCWGLDGRMVSVWRFAVGLLPATLRKPRLPDGYGDAALIGDFDEVRPRRAKFGIEGWTTECWVRIARTWQPSDVSFLLRQLSKAGSGGLTLHEYLSDSYRKIKRRRVLVGSGVPLESHEHWRRVNVTVAQWPSYGPWLGS